MDISDLYRKSVLVLDHPHDGNMAIGGTLCDLLVDRFNGQLALLIESRIFWSASC